MDRLNSLTARVLIYTTIWSAIGVVIMAVVISTLYEKSAEKSLRDLLRAQLFSAINSVSIDPATKKLTGSPQLSELGFQQPASGWYWQVLPLGDYKTEALSSPSYENVEVPTVPNAVVPFNPRFERYYATEDSSGNPVRVAEAEISLDEEPADEDTITDPENAPDPVYRVVRFRMIGNHTVVEDDVAAFDRSLYLALGLFGAGSLVLNALVILLGLRPLDRVRQSLTRIRNGQAEKLDEDLPREIQPLAHEVNALIESNKRVMERARMQVGNLAHSLKTPIAVLLNDAGQMAHPHGTLVRSQAETMQVQVQSYLNRARIAALRESILARTEVGPVLERLVRVMRKLNPGKQFDLSVEPKGLKLAMEAQDLEETIGNLIENASRFAKRKIRIEAGPAPAGTKGADPGRKIWALLIIEDDGPGLDPEQITEAMKRGKRLDESKPGTGLGLSIVTEIVSEYQGAFTLERAVGGGLRAELILPALAT
ncbi:HAMP domain-containing histidine kinase [Rhizobium sp. KVB221]|uniref:histidine kinase n=1 Tax=Rhizobium setariae TaxID=2801340 RepID=A0A936YK66_9HYPH|nr:HAMP domain-containing sensor histidine kinase [Rhizobium setariae]MBL0371088.1 HAMP domain-containing histidine kinase [Rhizobium setariae]